MVSVSYGHGQLYDFPSNFLFLGSSTYTTSGDGAGGGTTTVDASLTQADDYWNGCYIKYLTATNTDNIGAVREITDFDDGTDTLTHDAFPSQTKNGDTFQLSYWRIIEDGQTLSTPSCYYDDLLVLSASGSAGNKDGYVENRVGTELGLSTTLYPYCRYRAKSLGTANYKIEAVYNDASTSTILAEGHETTWQAGTTALTASKTLNHIRFYCNDAASTVYYDFALVYVGDFTFPNGAYGISGTIPNRNVHLQIPSRQGTITQNLGSDDFEYNIGCDLTNGTWTRTGDDVNGQVFYDIAHNANSEEWQWLDTEREQMKVTLEPVRFTREASRNTLIDRMDLTLKEYRRCDAGNALTSYYQRWGLNL